jgi:hypothetical protein
LTAAGSSNVCACAASAAACPKLQTCWQRCRCST